MTYDVIIIGGGVSGLAASIYSARYNLKTLILAEKPGGLIMSTHLVENYPGFTSLTGYELAQNILKHAKSYNIEIKEEKAIDLSKKDKVFTIKTNKSSYNSKTVIIATGSEHRKLNIPGEKELLNKGVSYCATCLPPNESIIANSSIKEIKDINPLNRVLTIDGTYQEIEGFTKTYYDGNLINIKTKFFNEAVSLTPNHPVLTTNIKKGIGTDYWKKFKINNPKWKEAGALTKEDWVLYPIIKETKDKKNIKISDFIETTKLKDGFIISKRPTHTSNKIPNKIDINKNFMRLVGYYLAEGHTHKHMLTLSFNKNEKEYIKDVKDLLKKIFRLKPNIKIEKNVCKITIYSKLAANLFKLLFGKYAHKKQIPHWIMILPKEKQKELIKGYWRGDGCIREKDFCFVTSSRQLAYQIRDILFRQKIISSLNKRKKEDLKPSSIEGRTIFFNHDKYNINIGGQFLDKGSEIIGIKHPLLNKRKSTSNHAWIHKDFAIIPIKEINTIKYSGDVLNLAVKTNNTYIAKNFIVHNCDAPIYKDKIVAVIGGSDSAAKEALLLSEYAKKVYIIYRKEKIRAEPINLQRIEKTKNIEIINNTNVIEALGKEKLEKVKLDKPYKNSEILELNGLFIEIGFMVNSDIAKQIKCKLEEDGSIIIDKLSKTCVPGLFAAGDCTNFPWKQAITGVAQGTTAAFSAYNYLKENP